MTPEEKMVCQVERLRAENERLRNRLLSVVFAGSRYIASHQGQRVVLQDAHAAGLYTEAADIFDALITKESLALNHDEKGGE